MSPVRARAMGFLSLFSGFMYKGSYNVEVRMLAGLHCCAPCQTALARTAKSSWRGADLAHHRCRVGPPPRAMRWLGTAGTAGLGLGPNAV